ncbi:MAG: hypothetical protein U0Q47_10275 [Mycobacterium sp.]
MSLFTIAAVLGSCGSAKFVVRSPLDLTQFIGQLRFHNEKGPFDSSAGGAVLSAPTLT